MVLQDQFRETPAGENGAPLPAALEGRDPETPVMMYCTGGIRCDIYSAYLRTRGFRCGAAAPQLASVSSMMNFGLGWQAAFKYTILHCAGGQPVSVWSGR